MELTDCLHALDLQRMYLCVSLLISRVRFTATWLPLWFCNRGGETRKKKGSILSNLISKAAGRDRVQASVKVEFGVGRFIDATFPHLAEALPPFKLLRALEPSLFERASEAP